MYVYFILAAAAVFCAAMAISARRMLAAALWLAGTSAVISALLYLLGAWEVAVIELSVGAGLVTILFVFAISIAGEEGMKERSSLPHWLAWIAIFAAMIVLGRQTLPLFGGGRAFELPFALVMWEQRSLDVLLQIVLILAGVVGALGLLADGKLTQAEQLAANAQTGPDTKEVQ